MRVLVAHGTRSPQGVEMIYRIAERVAAQVGAIEVCFIDVVEPEVNQVFFGAAEDAVVVPAFLASGYHVRRDIPSRVHMSGFLQRHRALITPALGPDHVMCSALAERLGDSGWRTGHSVLFAAAGSSDAAARSDVARAAEMLAAYLEADVRVGYVAQGTPTVRQVAEQLAAEGSDFAVASYLLSDGVFQRRIESLPNAVGVAAPLGVHPDVVSVLADRFTRGHDLLWGVSPESGEAVTQSHYSLL